MLTELTIGVNRNSFSFTFNEKTINKGSLDNLKEPFLDIYFSW